MTENQTFTCGLMTLLRFAVNLLGMIGVDYPVTRVDIIINYRH